MGESTQIEIMGQKFFLKGSHDKEYISRVEKYINNKIEEVEHQSSGSITTYNLMILVALNLADDCIKKEDQINGLTESVENKSASLAALIDSHI